MPSEPSSDLRLYKEEDTGRFLEDYRCRAWLVLRDVHGDCLFWLSDFRILRTERHTVILQGDSWCSGCGYCDCHQDVHHVSHTAFRWQVVIQIFFKFLLMFLFTSVDLAEAVNLLGHIKRLDWFYGSWYQILLITRGLWRSIVSVWN